MLPAAFEARPELLLIVTLAFAGRKNRTVRLAPWGCKRGSNRRRRAWSVFEQSGRRFVRGKRARRSQAVGLQEFASPVLQFVRAHKKAPENPEPLDLLLCRSNRRLVPRPGAIETLVRFPVGLGHKALPWPEALPGKLGLQATNLLHFRYERLVRLLCEFDLNLDRLIE